MQEYSPLIGLLHVAPLRQGWLVVKHGLYQSQFRPWYPVTHRHW